MGRKYDERAKRKALRGSCDPGTSVSWYHPASPMGASALFWLQIYAVLIPSRGSSLTPELLSERRKRPLPSGFFRSISSCGTCWPSLPRYSSFVSLYKLSFILYNLKTIPPGCQPFGRKFFAGILPGENLSAYRQERPGFISQKPISPALGEEFSAIPGDSNSGPAQAGFLVPAVQPGGTCQTSQVCIYYLSPRIRSKLMLTIAHCCQQ